MDSLSNELAEMESGGWKALEGMTGRDLDVLDKRIRAEMGGAWLREDDILNKGLSATAGERLRRTIEAIDAERERQRKWDSARSAANLIANAIEKMEHTRGIEFQAYDKPMKPIGKPESMSDAELARIVGECKREIDSMPPYDESLFMVGLLGTEAAHSFVSMLTKAAEAREKRIRSLEANLTAANAERQRRIDAESARAARADEIRDKLADIVESLDSRISQLEGGK